MQAIGCFVGALAAVMGWCGAAHAEFVRMPALPDNPLCNRPVHLMPTSAERPPGVQAVAITPAARPLPAAAQAMTSGRLLQLEGQSMHLAGEAQPFYLDDTTALLRDGKAVTPRELAAGDELQVHYRLAEGRRLATQVEARSAPQRAAPAAPSARP